MHLLGRIMFTVRGYTLLGMVVQSTPSMIRSLFPVHFIQSTADCEGVLPYKLVDT